MKTNTWKRFLRGAGQTLANGILTTDPIAYSYFLMCKAEGNRQVASVAGGVPSVAVRSVATTEAPPALACLANE
jgi:hypothetical protein